MIETFDEAAERNSDAGRYWFSSNTMRGFGTVLDEIYPTPKGAVFTYTNENAPSGPEFRVNYIGDDGKEGPYGCGLSDEQQAVVQTIYDSLAEAQQAASELAAAREVAEA